MFSQTSSLKKPINVNYRRYDDPKGIGRSAKLE